MSAAIDVYFQRSRDAGWLSNDGPCLRLFGDRLEDWLPNGVSCVPLANGTLALALALKSLTSNRSPEQSEVIMPSFTFAAVANAAHWAGLRPAFVDVDEGSWHAAPAAITSALEERGAQIAAVLVCSTFGTPPAAETTMQWEAEAARFGKPLVVDSAAGFGSESDHGDLLGGQGDAEIFSFHATKTFAVGEGGAVATKDKHLARKVRASANFGFNEDRVVDGEPGINAKMSELTAATGLAVLDQFVEVLERRRATAAKIVGAATSLGFTAQDRAAQSTWQFVPLLAPSSEVRARVLTNARRRSIELRDYFNPPLHAMPAFSGCIQLGSMEVTDRLSQRMLSLPMSNTLTDEQVEVLIKLLEESV